ncbi:MAG: glycosyltransferase family 4 protein [Magnetococcus sp. DMHC-6]
MDREKNANKKKLHVMQLFHARYPEILGGIDMMLVTLMEGLLSRCQVTLFIPGEWSDNQWKRARYHDILTIRQRLHMPKLEGSFFLRLKIFLGWAWEFPQTLWKLKKILFDMQVDVIHIHTLHTYSIYFYILRKLGGPPYLVTLHGTDLVKFNRHVGLTRWFLKKVLSGAELVVTVSPSMLTLAQKTLEGLVSVVSVFNGYSLPKLSTEEGIEKRASIDLPLLPKRFALMVGWICLSKGVDLVVRNWPDVLLRHPDLHFVHVGSEQFSPAFSIEIKQLAYQIAPDHIHFLGSLPHDLLLKIYTKAELFLMPSESEGMPYALLEAGMLGVPAVLSRIPAFESFIEEGKEAFFCHFGDDISFLSAVDSLVSSPLQAKEIGYRLQKKLKEHCSMEAMCDHYFKIYCKIVKLDIYS